MYGCRMAHVIQAGFTAAHVAYVSLSFALPNTRAQRTPAYLQPHCPADTSNIVG